MISELRIERFKCFRDQKVQFRNLTLLVGGNATGKSTVIQSLLLLRQAYLSGKLEKGELPLSGELVTIGSARDAWYSGGGQEDITFAIAETKPSHELVYAFQYPRESPGQYALYAHHGQTEITSIFTHQFTYLHAERQGPRLYSRASNLPREEANVGIYGEYTFYCLAAFGTERIGIPALAHPDDTGYLALERQTTLWMKPVAPNLELEMLPVMGADIVQAGLKNHGIATDYLRPTNLGFGISYALPIVVAALMSKPGALLIVENPEAHLHPAAQSEMGKFLARVAAAGVQVIIETHSDHILNGIRVAVKHKDISPDEVSIQFFTYGDDELGHQVIAPRMYADGGIDIWPEGFFDQAEEDLLELL